jgi:orotidine-5'-phosphate decarboxylase
MQAAAEGRGASNLKLLAVSVLTSFDQQDILDLGYPCEVSDLVDLRVRKAMKSGIDGVVASPLDAARIRGIVGPDIIIVTPGVRSAGSTKGDQKRVATPAEAVRDGADYIVMGRQISRSADPAGEVARVLEEISSA